jgi:hypothetical protein
MAPTSASRYGKSNIAAIDKVGRNGRSGYHSDVDAVLEVRLDFGRSAMLGLQPLSIKAFDFIVDSLRLSWLWTRAPRVHRLRADDVCYGLHDDWIALVHLRASLSVESDPHSQSAAPPIDGQTSHDCANELAVVHSPLSQCLFRKDPPAMQQPLEQVSLILGGKKIAKQSTSHAMTNNNL